jgi:hypothetical protein
VSCVCACACTRQGSCVCARVIMHPQATRPLGSLARVIMHPCESLGLPRARYMYPRGVPVVFPRARHGIPCVSARGLGIKNLPYGLCSRGYPPSYPQRSHGLHPAPRLRLPQVVHKLSTWLYTRVASRVIKSRRGTFGVDS